MYTVYLEWAMLFIYGYVAVGGLEEEYIYAAFNKRTAYIFASNNEVDELQ